MSDFQKPTDPSSATTFAAAIAASPPLRRIGYDEVQQLAELAAVRLVDALGRDALRSATFVPIPRAGLVVAGLLSYLLDLRPQQLQAPPSGGLVVVVDDCALSGLRVRQALADHPERPAAVVHLLSPPPFRHALRDVEPRVRAVVAGGDLSIVEIPRELREAWSRELGPGRVWIGRAEPVCFPWGEPDGWLRSRDAGRRRPAPRSSPPHLSLKSRAALVGPLRQLPATDWTLPEDLRWQESDGTFWLARPDGCVASLEGTAADAWRHLAGWGRLDVAARELAELWSIDAGRALEDLRAFARELKSQGLILGPDDTGDVDEEEVDASET